MRRVAASFPVASGSARSWRAGAVLGASSLLALGVPAWSAPDAVGPAPGAAAPRGGIEAKVELGRRLFFDPVASRSGERSCASCHDPEHGFSDTQAASDDDVLLTVRHSQTLIDGHLNPSAHWDGQFGSIEELVFARLDLVDGVKGRLALRTGSGGGGGYGPPAPPPTSGPRQRTKEPDDADGAPDPEAPPTTPPDGESPQHAGPNAKEPGSHGGGSSSPAPGSPDAASKERAEQARGRRPGESVKVRPLDLTRLPNVAKTIEDAGRYAEGFRAAFGSAEVNTARMAEAIGAYCRSLHSTEAPIDRYLAGQKGALSPAARRGLELFQGRAGCVQCHVMEGQHPTFTDFRFHNTGVEWRALHAGVRAGRRQDDPDEDPTADPGREAFSKASSDRRAFKTATLRDLARRGPYMHTGAFDSLEAVVRHYARGGADDPHQDPRLRPLRLEDRDVADLVLFLGALQGDEQPGLAATLGPARAERTNVRLVDAKQRPLVGWAFELVPEGDRLPGPDALRDRAVAVTTDADGAFSFSPGLSTHVRLALPEGLVPVGGALLPDSCREAVVTVPIDGRVTLVVGYEARAEAPARLVAEHEGTMRLPGHAAPRTVFERVTALDVAGRPVVSYEGWLRTDVPPDVVLRLPGDRRDWPEHRLRLTDARTVKLDLTK